MQVHANMWHIQLPSLFGPRSISLPLHVSLPHLYIFEAQDPGSPVGGWGSESGSHSREVVLRVNAMCDVSAKLRAFPGVCVCASVMMHGCAYIIPSSIVPSSSTPSGSLSPEGWSYRYTYIYLSLSLALSFFPS